MPGRRSGRENRSAQDWRSSGRGEDDRRGGREGRGRSGPEMGGRGGGWRHTNNLNLHVFVSRDREPRHQHDMRAFVMSARLHFTTGKLSEVISWLGDTSQFGVSRVMDICRASSTTLDVDAGPIPSRVSFQRVFLPLIDLATSTEFKNSPLRSETNVLFSTLYKLDQADGLWPRVFDELSKLTTRGSVRDTSYTAFHRDRDNQISGVWEPSTWVDVVLPIARFMVEVTKRFRDAVLLDTSFQKAATETLPNLIAAWKTGGGRGGDPPPSRTQLLEVDDAMANLDRVIGATLQILRASEAARAERENEKRSRNARLELFNLSDSQGQTEGATYDGPGVFSRLQVKRHDNDAERISEISVAPTAGEILCERPPYVPRNASSTWDRMKHLKPLAPDSPAPVLDTHFRLLRQDFVEPLREAVLGYRREKLKAQDNGDDGGVGGGRGVFKAQTEGGRSFLNLFVFKNIRVVGISGTTYGGVKVSLEFDKPDAVMNMSQNKQRDHWERSGRLAVANMVVICEAHVTAAGDTANEGNSSPPLLVFAVISERDVRKLSGPSPRAEIGVSFDSSAGTVAALESLLDLGGRTSDGRLLMLQPSNSYFAYRPILQVLKSPAREVLPFADTLLPPSAASAAGATARDATEPKPPRYLLQVDAYDLTDLISTREGNAEAPLDALRSVSMLDRERFPMTELLDHTTLDQAQLEALRAALSQEVALIQGPPGTGKTFVGAKVVRLLLTNRRMLSHWRGPIMCVCLTNHALDQFLCDLLDAGVDGIVRVGGSCKTDRLKRFMLRELSQGRRDSCGKEMYRLRNLMKELSDDMRNEWEWAGGVTAITANLRDANWSTTEVLHRLLVSHAPPVFEEAIVNGNKHPVVDEDGWQTVGEMPSGIKDWLAGKKPADVRRRRQGCRRKKKPCGVRTKEVSGAMTNHDDNDRTRRKASLPDAQDGKVAGTNERKRRDQQRALDRRAAATVNYPDARRGAGVASSISVPSEPLPSADGTRAGESKQTTEDLDDDDRVAAGKETADANSRATKQGEDHIATGIARSVAAGSPWLALADLNHDSSGDSSDYSSMSGGEPAFDLFDVEAEPKNTISGGGVNGDGASSWSFANSGLAPMADGEEWEMFESEETDDDAEGHVDGGHLEAKGNSPSSETHPDGVHPPAALPRTPATSGAQQQRQNQKRQHVEQSRGFGAGRGRSGRGRGRGRGHGTIVDVRFAAGPDDVGGPGFGAGRGKRDDAEMKVGERSVGNSEGGSSSLDEDDEGHRGSTSDGLEQGSGDEGEEETDSVASSMSEDPQSKSSDDEDSGDGSSEEGDPGDARPTPPAGAVDGLNDYDIIVSAVLNGRSVWALSPEQRRTLCRHWQQTEAEASRERLARMIEDFFSLWERHDNHKTQGELAVLQEANVVGMTTTGVAMHHSLVEALGATVVVVEEAAEVMEAHILAVLTQSTQHLILIGDHLQLRPKAEVYRLTKESRKGFDLDVSMFERLVKERRVPVHDLATQRRMRPEIADLIRPAVYPNLKDARQVQKYPPVKGMRRNLFFWDHAVPEDKSGTIASSKTNRHEAKLVSGLVQYLLKQGYTDRGDITVLTPYLGQLFVLRDVVGNSSVLHVQVNERDSATMDEMTMGDSNGKDGQPNSREFDDTSDVDGGTNASPFVEVAHKRVGSMVRMATVDNFQGEESKIIIMSLVRSNRNADIGFLRSSNRVNVALSRAQHGMYIIGNAGMLESKRGTMWSESVIPTLREKGAIGTTLELQCARHKDSITVIHKYEEFASLAGDGGCSRACSSRLPCGHACLRRCHPDDPHHLGVRCSEPCPRLLQPCEHPCQRLCGDECGPCYQRVDVVGLPCGHEAKNVSCATSRHPKSIWCGEPVELKVPGCGHEIKGRCTATRDIVRNPAKCTETCGKPLPCGHSCAATCGSCTQLTLSRATTAAETTPPQQKQEAPTATAGGVWATADGDGQAKDDDRSLVLAAAVAVAAEQRTHHAKCTTECGRHRSCGHRCRLPCHEGEPCPPCPEPCTLSCEHSSCAQACIDPCTLCAQSCTWHCPHQAGSCRLPCGAPCVRLPCDIRCERKLPCGHRCPSVCGEDCPGSEFCRECGRADSPAMTQVVDMLEFTTLKDHDPSIDPIIVLGCGHAYTLKTLDCLLGLESAYAKDEKSGRWVAPLPLESDCSKLKLCPDCRAPVSGVSRYNRVTNKAKMDMAEVKHSEWCRKEIAFAHTDLVVAAADGTKPKLRNNRMRQAEGTLKRVIQASQETPCTRVFEAATATLMRAGASAHELATVSRLQPDHSVRVKAMTGIGRLRTLQLEACRLQLAKAVRSMAFTSTSLIQAMQRMPPTANTESQHARRAQAINRAKTLEASTSLKYRQGEDTLLAAVQDAVAARAMAAGAAARMALVDLYLQGAQCVIVSKDLSLAEWASFGCDTRPLTNIGRQMVQKGINECRTVASISLGSVRQQHEEHVETSMKHLLSLDETMKGISQKEVEIVMAVAADSGLSGGVTKYHKCPNGHVYGVGDCGLLNGRGICPECGLAIGGPGYH